MIYTAYDVHTLLVQELPEIEVEELDVEVLSDEDYCLDDVLTELDAYAR